MQRRGDVLRAAIDEVGDNNRQVDEFMLALEKGDPIAIARYFQLVFQQSQYPAGFPKKYKVAYIADSRQLVVECQIPTIDEIVPSVEKYKYAKSADEILETRKPEKIRQQLYSDAVSSTALRTLQEIFASDTYNHIDVTVLNAFVDTIDRSTGQPIQPYILSTRTTRDEFEKLVLRNVDPTACLKRMTATISRSPAELVPIKPIVDFNMVDLSLIHI